MPKKRKSVHTRRRRLRAEEAVRRGWRDPPPLTIRYVCPICGGDHSRSEHRN